MAIDWNDPNTLRQADDQHLLEQLEQYGARCAQGYDQAVNMSIPARPDRVDEIVLCSVGGGPVAALLQVRSMLYDLATVPVILHQAYTMPAFVDGNSLVFIVNYSGGSEEMVSAYRSAAAAGAFIVAMTAGGTIGETARKEGRPLFELPSGSMVRFISTSHVVIPVLVLLHRFGLIPDLRDSIDETIELFGRLHAEYGPASPPESNPAKRLAAEMRGMIPAVYGTLPLTDSAAYRLKHQLAENAGMMAWAGAMSALHHDEAYGWDADEAVFRRFHFTLIRDAEDSARMSRRIDATAEVLAARAGAVRIVASTGSSRLARLCSLVYLFDCLTVYLALRQGGRPGKALNEFRAAFHR